MASPEEKDKIENQETQKVSIETQEEKEISPEEFLQDADIKKQEFEAQTEKEINNLNSVNLDAQKFNEIKKEDQIEQKLDETNQEVGVIIQNAKNEVKSNQDTKKESESSQSDENKLLEMLKEKIEKSDKLEDIFSILKETLQEQKERSDLKMLFTSFKFTTDDGNEKLININDYFEETIKKIEEISNDTEKMKEVQNIPLSEIKKEFIGLLDDFVLPHLDEELNLSSTIEKIQNKMSVKDFYIGDLINFLNEYNKVSKNRENTFDKFIFKDYPKNKDDFFNVKGYLNDLIEDPSLLEKIDFINENDLNKRLDLFDNESYYRREYEGPESAKFVGKNNNILDLGMIEDEKGVNTFNVEDTQRKRISDLKTLSLESLKLADKNKYFLIESSFLGVKGINLINENQLKEIHDFTGDLEKLDTYQIANYHGDIENLSPEIKSFLQKYEADRMDNLSLVGNSTFFRLVKDENNFNKIKNCINLGLLKSIHQEQDMERAVSFDAEDINLILKTEEDLSISDYLLEKIKTLSESDIVKYKELKNKFAEYYEDKAVIIDYLEKLKEIPNENLNFFELWQNSSGRYSGGLSYRLNGPLREAINYKEDLSKLAKFYKNDPDAETIIFGFITKDTKDLSSICRNVELFEGDPKKYFVDNPKYSLTDYDKVQAILNKRGQKFEQADFDLIFDYAFKNSPQSLLEKSSFPFSPEQKKIIDIFTKINNSPSKEMKNIAVELSWQIVQGGDLATIDDRYNKIENIFVRNNIPFVGKQEKICEVIHPEIRTQYNSSPELQSLHSDNAKRLLIFKDLLKASFNSLNSNLEQYLVIFQNGQEVLNKYEKGEKLNDDEEEKLKYFFRKINALSENTRKTANFKTFDLDNLSLEDNLIALKNNFGVKDKQTITEKFETTFLNRIGMNNFGEAVKYYKNLRETVSARNQKLAIGGQINLSENDLAKGISLNFFDNSLDKGVYAPEFVGSETIEAKSKAKDSDATPWDTDLIRVGERNITEIATNSTASGYGEIILIIKDRGQFNKNEKGQPLGNDQNKLELFKTGVLGQDHYGIRTGFGSTEIDAVLVKDNLLNNNNKQLDSLKFSIAKKGFYIPICDKTGSVIFSAKEYEEYRKVFDGVDKYHGGEININEEWKQSSFNEAIKEFSQTKENLDKINNIRNDIYSDIESDLKTFGIELHKGRYDDSVVGAKIIDTGSTGRGAALDSGYDFDFVIKIDDQDFDKINQLAENLKNKYPYDQDYERDGMRTFRFKSFEKNGNLIDLDISFVKKSDSEDLDANEAVAKKYDSIKESKGEDKLLDVLTNIRFAKKELKNAGCYKKGLTGNGEQQGGLGGIGVENWILKNGGDAVVAFQEFNKMAYKDGELIPFDDFKKEYKIFSAGENIRGGVRAENFVYNMDQFGYEKMAELSKKFVEIKKLK